MKSIVLVLSLCLLSVVYAHPPTTFSMLLANENNPNTTINKPYNLTFEIYDLLHNSAIVNFSQLVPEHDRFMHVMLACGNMQEVFHLHPEDFSTPEQMRQKNTYIATSFMANISGHLREGSSQYEFYVEDSAVFTTYPLPSSQLFTQEVNTKTNIQTVGGYTVEVTFSPNTTHIQPFMCQPFYVTVKDPKGQPVTNFIPYLDAPMHIIFVAEADTVYHGHGMDLPSIAPDLDAVKTYARMAGMSGMGGMTQEEDAVMMNAMMIGINNQGVLNCTQDLGAVMQKYNMDPWMPMLPTSNYTFGPNFMSIFDFPNFGNWEMFIYFRVQEGTQSKLIVPHFSLNSDNRTCIDCSTTGGNVGSSAVHVTIASYLVAVLAICSWIFL